MLLHWGCIIRRINEKDVMQRFTNARMEYFNTRVYYNSYEVTDFLRYTSENFINVILADGYIRVCGWEREEILWEFQHLNFSCMHWDYEDGSSEIIATDERLDFF